MQQLLQCDRKDFVSNDVVERVRPAQAGVSMMSGLTSLHESTLEIQQTKSAIWLGIGKKPHRINGVLGCSLTQIAAELLQRFRVCFGADRLHIRYSVREHCAMLPNPAA